MLKKYFTESHGTQDDVTPRVEFFRLPNRGGDPYFHLSRSWYYAAEKSGWLRLVRLRDRGKQRGVVLIPHDQVLAYIRRQMEEQEAI